MTKKRRKQLDVIFRVVSGYFGCTVEEALYGNRENSLKIPRQFIKYYLKDNLSMGWSDIANATGGDHSTAIHSYKTISNLIDVDSEYKEYNEDLVARIEAEFKNNLHKNYHYDLQRKLRRGKIKSNRKYRAAA